MVILGDVAVDCIISYTMISTRSFTGTVREPNKNIFRAREVSDWLPVVSQEGPPRDLNTENPSD